jgi:hypothetical protein
VQGELAVVQRTFFQRFGTHGVCVLPPDVLSNDLLRFDSEAHTMPPTLRKEASALGLCYARVLRCFADDLYWALVAATPDLVDAQRVVLTEEQLYHALPWDVRLVDQEPETIRRLMFAHAQAVKPAQRLETSEQTATTSHATAALTPVPVLLLEPVTDAMVEVSASHLQEALDPHSPHETDESIPRNKKRSPFKQSIGSFPMQQGLLRVMIDALMTQLYQAQDHPAALSLKARCTLLAQMQRWHRASRQRIVNAIPVWNDELQRVVWQLTVGVPLAAYAAA